jgi:hypothetical protein
MVDGDFSTNYLCSRLGRPHGLRLHLRLRLLQWLLRRLLLQRQHLSSERLNLGACRCERAAKLGGGIGGIGSFCLISGKLRLRLRRLRLLLNLHAMNRRQCLGELLLRLLQFGGGGLGLVLALQVQLLLLLLPLLMQFLLLLQLLPVRFLKFELQLPDVFELLLLLMFQLLLVLLLLLELVLLLLLNVELHLLLLFELVSLLLLLQLELHLLLLLALHAANQRHRLGQLLLRLL